MNKRGSSWVVVVSSIMFLIFLSLSYCDPFLTTQIPDYYSNTPTYDYFIPSTSFDSTNLTSLDISVLSTDLPYWFGSTYEQPPLEIGTFYLGALERWFVYENYAYLLVEGRGLLIYDVSDKSTPTFIGSFEDPGQNFGVYPFIKLVANYAYVTLDDGGLKIIDVSDKKNPMEVNRSNPTDALSEGKAFDIEDDIAHIADSFDYYVVNITDKKNPKLIGSLEYSQFSSIQYFHLKDGYAYFTRGSSTGVRIVNATNSSNPELVATFSNGKFFYDIHVEGNYLFAAHSSSGLYSYDISDKTSPVKKGEYTANTIYYVTIKDGIAYAGGSSGLFILDVSNPLASPFPELSTFDENNYGYHVYIDEDEHFAYIEQDVVYGLTIVNCTDKTQPSESSVFYRYRFMYDLALADENIAYTANDAAGIFVLNISDPKNIRIISNFTPAVMDVRGVIVKGQFLYVAGDGFSSGGVAVYDISSSSKRIHPSFLGSVSGFSVSSVNYDSFSQFCVDELGLYVFAIKGDSIKVINVTDKSNPTEIKQVDLADCATIRSVFFADGYLYVGISDEFRILDVRNITNIKEVLKYSTIDDVYEVYVRDDIAYLGYGSGFGIGIFNVSNKTEMSILRENYDTDQLDARTFWIQMFEHYLIVESGRDGIAIVDVSDPGNPTEKHNVDYGTSDPDIRKCFLNRNFLYCLCRDDDMVRVYRLGDLRFTGTIPSKYECGNVSIRIGVKEASNTLNEDELEGMVVTTHFFLNFTKPCVHGNCSGPGGQCKCLEDLTQENCTCYDHFGYYGKWCEYINVTHFCPSNTWNPPDHDFPFPCHGFGECTTPNSCTCYNNATHWGKACERWKCFGNLNNDTENVCNGHGICIDHDTCECEDDYDYPEGPNCNVTTCSIYKTTSENSCSGHGKCLVKDNCSCDIGYFHSKNLVGSIMWEYCDSFTCQGVINKDWKGFLYVFERGGCSHHGHCVDLNVCECDKVDDDEVTYWGQFCQIHSCQNVSIEDPDSVCGGHGNCVDHDHCLCKEGYSSSSLNSPCDVWFCNNIKVGGNDVCNGRGQCVASGECLCSGGYEGESCDEWSCFSYDKDNTGETCSGRGVCREPDVCDCGSGFSGESCETNMLYYYVMTPILSMFTVVVIVLVALCFCCLVLTFFVILVVFCCLFLGLVFCFLLFGCFLVLIFVVICCVCSGVVVRLIFGMKKYGKLRNFDLLLKEQELEDDGTIATLKFNKSLFEIDFKDIETISILGEGGSNSTVFKSRWKGNICAFKCFKTRTILSGRDDFEEFEREVELMTSLSHPFVIRFFGACLNPPRVGILMEYCANGELLDFVIKFRENHMDICYPIFEKIRMLQEIASALDYLHGLSVIHRDLKPENVLISERQNCKVMDFGLSRVIKDMSDQKTKRVGTSVYMAPELVLMDIGYDEKCDVYSYSILAFVLLTENPHPFGDNEFQVELKVAQDEEFRPKVNELESKLESGEFNWLIEMIQKCWSHDPSKRYSMAKIVEILDEKKSVKKEEQEQEVQEQEKQMEMEKLKDEEKEKEGHEGEEGDRVGIAWIGGLKKKKISYEELEKENKRLKQLLEGFEAKKQEDREIEE